MSKVRQVDIANALGISRNTVSKVLNNNASVKETTKDIVLRKAAEMGYRPVPMVDVGRGVGRNSEELPVAVVMSGNSDPNDFWAPVLRGIESKLATGRRQVVVNFIPEESGAPVGLPPQLTSDAVAGIFAIGRFSGPVLQQLNELPLVKILIAPPFPPDRIEWNGDLITNENEHGTHEIVNRLVAQGHQRIGFFGNINRSPSYRERFEGYRNGLISAGLRVPTELCFLGEDQYGFEPVQDLDTALAEASEIPTAYVCACDKNAYRLIRGLRKRGIMTPRDIAVAGFDDRAESPHITPPLTSVRVPTYEMGRRAVEEYMWRHENPDRPHEAVRLAVTVHFRESTELYGVV